MTEYIPRGWGQHFVGFHKVPKSRKINLNGFYYDDMNWMHPVETCSITSNITMLGQNLHSEYILEYNYT